MSSSSLACSSCALLKPKRPLQQRKRSIVQVKAQRFPEDQGSSSQSHIVDANLRILTKRIAEIKLKERLERCCRCELGWNYAPGYGNPKENLKRNAQDLTLFEVVRLVCVNIAFTFIGGTFCLCMVSLIVHLSSSTN